MLSSQIYHAIKQIKILPRLMPFASLAFELQAKGHFAKAQGVFFYFDSYLT